MFYHNVVITSHLKTPSSHVDKKTSGETVSSSLSFRRRAARLRKVRWSIYQNIRLGDQDVRSLLGYYRSLSKRFLVRFSGKLKPREVEIWNEKIKKTVKDVTQFLKEKATVNSTSETNIKPPTMSGNAFDAPSRIDENQTSVKESYHARNVKKVLEHKCTCTTIMSEYMDKMDSALLMVSTILHLIRNEETAKPFEVPAKETLNDGLKDFIEASTCPRVVLVADDNAAVNETVVEVEEISKARIEETAMQDTATVENSNAFGDDKSADNAFTPVEKDVKAFGRNPVMEPVNKDGEEYAKRIKDASNRFLSASGVLNKICPRGSHIGYAILDCKCDMLVTQPIPPRKK